VSVLTSRHSKTFNLSLSKATLAMAIFYLLTNSDPSPVINFEINESSVYFLQHIDNNSIMQQIVLKKFPQVKTNLFYMVCVNKMLQTCPLLQVSDFWRRYLARQKVLR